jgi:hypothetical protein
MLRQKCVEYKSIIKRLMTDLRLSKSLARQTKHQIRIDYDRDGKEADFADSVSTLLRNICFHIICSRRMDGWNMTTAQTACPHLYRGR